MSFLVAPKTDFQELTFNNLMTLVAGSNGEFLFQDHPIAGQDNLVYRMFNYSLPGYMSFKQPSAKQCRGSMFLLDKTTNQAQLIALPMDKFFSIGEGVGEDLKFKVSDAKRAFIKEDGSLLTSYLCPFEKTVKLKSMSQPLYINAEIINKSVPDALAKELGALAHDGICVDLELTTPENRVIIEYKDYKVTVIQARSILTGHKVDIRSDEFKHQYPNIAEHLVQEVAIEDVDLERSDIEGYVFELADGTLKKGKTIPYLSIVSVIKIQDFRKEAEYLYSAAINKVLDEVRSLFVYRAYSENYDLEGKLAKADKVEKYASETYNGFVTNLNRLFEENKHLDRREFATKLNKEKGFSIMMKLYSGEEVKPEDYKKEAIKLFAKKALD